MTGHLSYTLLFEWEKKCFSDTFPWHLLSVSFRLKVAHTFRKTAVIERSGSFLSYASIQTQGVCALRHLCLREASPAKLCWEDLRRLRVGQTRTAGHEDQPGCPSCLSKYSWSLEMLLLQHRLLHQVTRPKERSTHGVWQAVLVSLCYLTSLRL